MNMLPIRHIIGALLPQHIHTLVLPQQEVGRSLFSHNPAPTEACCSDNCSPKLMASPGALVHVCVCVYVCVNNRCISFTKEEQ